MPETAPPTGEPETPPTDDNTPAPQTPPSTPVEDAHNTQQLVDAEQRATEHADRAERLQAALDAVGAALNPDASSGEQDPAQLAAAVAERDTQLAEVSAQLRTARVELAAHKSAGEHGARADRLLNSRAFLDTVAGLDPDGPKFEQQLGAAITAVVEADPDLYRATPAAPARGGAEFNGPPSTDKRPATLHDAIAARLGG